MVAPGAHRLTVQAAEADTGPHHTAQHVAAGRKMAKGAEDGIDEIGIHGACLPGKQWRGWAGGRESR